MFEEKLLEPHFTSVLAPYMLDVVEQKRALGNKYNAGVEALSAFDDFCNEQQLRIPCHFERTAAKVGEKETSRKRNHAMFSDFVCANSL
mgnify:FL=1